LRPATLGTEAGRTRRQEREEASDRCDGEKAGGATASPVGERRSVRTIAQQQPNDRGGSRIKQNGKTKSKSFQGEKNQKAKAEFR